MKAKIASIGLRTLLVYLVLFSALGSLASPVRAAVKFNIGDTVEVINTLDVGLKVRDAPAGNVLGSESDGSRGTVLDGPSTAASVRLGIPQFIDIRVINGLLFVVNFIEEAKYASILREVPHQKGNERP